MARYVLKRLFGMIPTLLLVVLFVFFFVRLIPGNPARMLAGPDASLEDVKNIERNLGLDQPVMVQFVKYITGLLRGDLGMSLRTKKPVSADIAMRLWNTLKLTLAAITWSSIVGVLLGVWSARHRNKHQDYIGMTLAVSGISVPNFWVGFLLMMLFAVKLKWLPATGASSFKSLIMPAITLGTSIAAIVARFTRSSLLDVLKEDYIRTARAKGAKELRIVWLHAFRNSMISVVTVVGLQFGFLLGGSVVTEAVFAYPGIGFLLVESVSYRDYPAIQSLVLLFSLDFLVINLLVDILYAFLNPEIRLSK
ncbi:glutathione ABC transporter permease GsiC [Clostridia bacterium]|nr:glutathione ABC transporter permease GsiC [Clostridia bacterium]